MTVDTIQQPYTVRGLTLPNRLVLPPMCIFVAEPGTGVCNDRHLVHYGSIAESGLGLIIVEATAVQECGLISPYDLGLYKDSQVAPMKKLCDYIHNHTPSKIAVQLGHSGRKGLTVDTMTAHPKHLGPNDKYGHQCVSASAIPHSPEMLTPKELSIEEIEQLKKDWVAAAKRAVEAGFDAIEIHNAHGYLMNQFTSPISNHRTDKYGGSFENRIRLSLEVVDEMRKAIPETMPLIVRISCVDWVDGGVTMEESAKFAKELHEHGVDIIDCSSGGVSYKQQIRPTLGYQIDLSEKLKEMTDGVTTIAVGNITTYEQAREVIESGQGDLVAVGRAYLADPYWWRSALISQGVTPWHPERQNMGFGKSQRRLEAEKKATADSTSSVETKAEPLTTEPLTTAATSESLTA